jgi:hypothetical protein
MLNGEATNTNLVLPDLGSNARSTTLGGSTLNITPPMRLIFQLKHHKDTQNMKDIMHKDYQTDLQTIISPTTSG